MNSLFQKCLLLFHHDHLAQAEAGLQQLLQNHPTYGPARAILALCLLKRKQLPAALEQAQQAVQYASQDAYVYYVLASVWQEHGQYAQALHHIREAIRLDPSEPDQFAFKAQLHLDQGQWADALRSASQGLQVAPDSVSCLNLHAEAMLRLGQTSEAEKDLSVALSRNPEDSYTFANQGWIFWKQQDLNKAILCFREALRLDPENDFARQGLARTLKARHKVYAWRWQRWGSVFKADRIFPWAFLFSSYLAFQLLNLIPWAPSLVLTIQLPLWGLMALVVVGLAIDPLFDLVLRLDQEGRRLLSRSQINASQWTGFLVASAGVLWLYWLISQQHLYLLGAMSCLLLILPLGKIYECGIRSLQQRLAGITLIIALLAVLGLFFFGSSAHPAHKASSSFNLGICFLMLSGFGAIVATWMTCRWERFRPQSPWS